MLSKLGIEDRRVSKYYTRCPKCSSDRESGSNLSLGVFKKGSVAYIKCFHAEQCEWNKQFQVNLDEEEQSYEVTEEPSVVIPVPDSVVVPENSEHTLFYHYKNVRGELVGLIRRTQRPGEKKIIRPLFWEKSFGWMSMYPRDLKLLYGAENLANNTKPVLVVEGEKAANAAASVLKEYLNVVTWPLGSSNVKLGDWDLLRGRDVIIWPDNDAPGIKAADEVARSIYSSKIRILDVSEFEQGGDAADVDPSELKEVFKRLLKSATRFTARPRGHLTKETFENKLAEQQSNRKFGYANIDRIANPPASGLVIFLGRSAHGKSLFLYNLLRQQLDQKNKSTLFSYEVPDHEAFVKLIMAYESIPKTSEQDMYWNNYIQKLKDNQVPSKDTVMAHLESGLLSITMDNYSAEDLYDELSKPSYYGSVIFIDYIQLIPANTGKARYLEIQEICNRLREIANANNLLIITAAQLTPGTSPNFDQVREGRDIFFAAEQVFTIWNKIQGASDGWADHFKDVDADIVLKVNKNRKGQAGRICRFLLKNGYELREKL